MSGQRMIIMNAGSSYFEHVENYYGSNACEQNASATCTSRSHTDDQAGRRNNSIVGAKYGRTQPANTVCFMAFSMSHVGAFSPFRASCG